MYISLSVAYIRRWGLSLLLTHLSAALLSGRAAIGSFLREGMTGPLRLGTGFGIS